MKYTIEQFEIDFENAYDIEQKRVVLELALDNLDVTDPTIKEILLKYKEEFTDFREQMLLEEHQQCLKNIETKSAELYTCIKEYDKYVVGQNYYIKIDDIASELKEKWIEQGSPKEIMEAIEKIKPLIYIYTDNGIGTQMRKWLFIKKDSSFSEYFKKFRID